jgi:hypothetical protein
MSANAPAYPILTLAQAQAELALYTENDEDPCVDTNTVNLLGQRAQEATIWAASQPYILGNRIFPATNNGRWYRCTQAGTTGATEPVWPTNPATGGQQVNTGVFRYGYGPNWASMLTEGPELIYDETVIWRDIGVQPLSLWDIYYWAHLCWNKKRQLAATYFNFSIHGQSMQYRQVLDNCTEMAKIYAPVLF